MPSHCLECGSTDLSFDEAIPHEEVVGARTYFVDVPGVRCRACGEYTLSAAVLVAVERLVAQELVDDHVPDGASIRWIRKALGWPAKDLAALVGVTPETVSRWELGHQQPDRVMSRLLEQLFRDELAGRDHTRRLLESERAASTATCTTTSDGSGLSIRTSIVTRLEVPKARGNRPIAQLARCS